MKDYVNKEPITVYSIVVSLKGHRARCLKIKLHFLSCMCKITAMLLRFTLFVIKRSVNVISSEPPFIESNVRFTIVLKIFVWSNMNYLPMFISLKIRLFSTVVSLKK